MKGRTCPHPKRDRQYQLGWKDERSRQRCHLCGKVWPMDAEPEDAEEAQAELPFGAPR